MGIREKVEREIQFYQENNSHLKIEISELEKKVEAKKQKFMDIEIDMEESDNIFETFAELLRGRGIEPPERD